jgi:bacillithiol system protein YtxJ
MIKDLGTLEDVEALLAHSQDEPVLLFKHSTRCGISSAAWREVQRYDSANPDRSLYRVLVIEARPVSQEIARRTGVDHQSPQVLLIADGQVTWHTSHWSITSDALHAAMSEALNA